mmetsp:Transcript_91274/g.237811  ORF Transcript_91274/g.237811 Transcript_91274/m.237811 type:complete len:272 (-) Transcript_91274:25-840(-)
MERHLVVTGDLAQPGDVVEHRVVQGPQEEALLLGLAPALVDEVLVLLVAAHVDAVGPADVHGLVAVVVHDVDALGPFQGHGRVQVLLHDAVECREAPPRREAEVGNHLLQLLGELEALGVLRLPLLPEVLERLPTALGHLVRAAIRFEELLLLDRVLGDDLRGKLESQRERVGRGDGQDPLEDDGRAPDHAQRGDHGHGVVESHAHKGGHAEVHDENRHQPTVEPLAELSEGCQQDQGNYRLDEKVGMALHPQGGHANRGTPALGRTTDFK